MMAQVIQTICDVCLSLDDGTEEPGIPYRLGIAPPGEPVRMMIVDVCERHAEEMARPLRLLLEVGRLDGSEPSNGARGARAGVGTVECPECGKPYKNRGSLGAHLREFHGKTLGDLEGTKRGGARGDFKCPACDRVFRSAQAIGRHTKAIHGASLGALREAAEVEGPPSRRAAVTRAPGASEEPSGVAS